jgi:hypothetical protein
MNVQLYIMGHQAHLDAGRNFSRRLACSKLHRRPVGLECFIVMSMYKDYFNTVVLARY